MVDAIKADSGWPSLDVRMMPVTGHNRISAGPERDSRHRMRVDDQQTFERQKQVSFSTTIFYRWHSAQVDSTSRLRGSGFPDLAGSSASSSTTNWNDVRAPAAQAE